MGLLLTLADLAHAAAPAGTYRVKPYGGLNHGTSDGRRLPLCGKAAATYLARMTRLEIRYDGQTVRVNGATWTTITQTNLVAARNPDTSKDIAIEVLFYIRDGQAVAALAYTELDAGGKRVCTSSRAYSGEHSP